MNEQVMCTCTYCMKGRPYERLGGENALFLLEPSLVEAQIFRGHATG